MIKKIMSGGQTGADRAALGVEVKLDIPHGGWIPKDRETEDGTLPDIYDDVFRVLEQVVQILRDTVAGRS